MWPWEHAAFGYVLFSLLLRSSGRRPPTDAGAVAVLVGTQVPDLLDKPLAWWLDVLPAGRSLGHSLPFALPVIVAALVASRSLQRGSVGVAFGIGYLSHLAGDVVYPALLGGGIETRFLRYPFVDLAGTDSVGVAKLTGLVADFGVFLTTPRGTLYLFGEGLLLALALGVWVVDGRPGPALFRRGVRRAITG